ncbi:hypothetical protein P7H12_21535 [Paenibacillus larvae]|nr:hypothetical protein [Paenibacillus larvae]MDT2265644.1 hypothetical protein [Paenibacillus larvae]
MNEKNEGINEKLKSLNSNWPSSEPRACSSAEKTRSQSVKLAMAARVAAIDQYIEQLDHDLAEVQAEKRRVAKAVAAYMI